MKQTQTYSRADVALRNGKANSDVWIIIDNIVYDVTHYQHEHPGGGDLITEWAGKDATKEYESIGHSGDASRDLKKWRIGIVGSSKKMSVINEKDLPGKNEAAKKKKKFLFCS